MSKMDIGYFTGAFIKLNYGDGRDALTQYFNRRIIKNKREVRVILKERAEQILIESNAMLTGHFLLTSGRHSDRYMQCAQVLQYPEFTGEMACDLAEGFKDEKVDIVIGPAMGGLIIAYELARVLGAKSMFTERENSKMTLRRNFKIEPGANVVVAEDVVTTGGSVMEVIEIVKDAGANLVGVAVLVDRSGGKVDFGVKLSACYTTEVISYEPDNCPLCAMGKMPAVKPGSRKTE